MLLHYKRALAEPIYFPKQSNRKHTYKMAIGVKQHQLSFSLLFLSLLLSFAINAQSVRSTLTHKKSSPLT